jgi:hypothetical protein
VLDARFKIFLKTIDHRGIVARGTVDGFSVILDNELSRALLTVFREICGIRFVFYSHSSRIHQTFLTYCRAFSFDICRISWYVIVIVSSSLVLGKARKACSTVNQGSGTNPV